MIGFVLLPLLLVGTIVAIVLRLRHGNVELYRWLRTTAMSLACAYAGFFGLFVVGEAAQDPGGSAAFGLIAVWVVPTALLVVAAWRRPAIATVVLAALTAVAVGVGVWYLVDPQTWRAYEDMHGPVRAMAVFALSLPLAALAWRRPGVGAGLLLVLGVASIVAAAPTLAIGLPITMVGAMFLTAEALRRPE